MDSQEKSLVQDNGKKKYVTPELQIYGNLSQLTGQVGRVGASDGHNCSDAAPCKTHS